MLDGVMSKFGEMCHWIFNSNLLMDATSTLLVGDSEGKPACNNESTII